MSEFFKSRSFIYYLYSIISYLFFIAILLIASNYFFSPEQKFLELIIAISGAIFTGIFGFILTKEKDEGMKIFDKKIEASGKFLGSLEKLLLNNDLTASPTLDEIEKQKGKSLENEDELKKLIFILAGLKVLFREENMNSIIDSCHKIISRTMEYKRREKELDYSEIGNALFMIAIAFKTELNKDLSKEDRKNSAKKEEEVKQKLADMLKNVRESNNLWIENSEEKIVASNIQIWHVNTGEDPRITDPKQQYRCWQDMKDFGFWSAGGAERYVDAVKKLKVGDVIYAYISRKGYVGKGVVKSTLEKVEKFFEQDDIKRKLTEKSFTSLMFKENLENKSFDGFHKDTIGEYAVKVDWTYPHDGKPVSNPKMWISPATICLMNNEKNGEILDNVNWGNSN